MSDGEQLVAMRSQLTAVFMRRVCAHISNGGVKRKNKSSTSHGCVRNSAVRTNHSEGSLACVESFVNDVCCQKTRCRRLPFALQLAHALDVRKSLLKTSNEA